MNSNEETLKTEISKALAMLKTALQGINWTVNKTGRNGIIAYNSVTQQQTKTAYCFTADAFVSVVLAEIRAIEANNY